MSDKLKLLLVAGARPNFMKIAPVIRAIQSRPEVFTYVLVHTGQHYDEGMSEVFFRELNIPAPTHYLQVGSASHAQQTARIMMAFEPVLKEENPDCVMVFGDVNSTLACSIVAKKLHFPIAHVEAGLRSGDDRMPEEINRIVTDSVSDFFFVTEASGLEHLEAEGKDAGKVFLGGHVMIDNLFFEVARLNQEGGDSSASTPSVAYGSRFGVVTMHRPSNVDDRVVFEGILSALAEIAREVPLVFPMHPRTRAAVERYEIDMPRGVHVLNPLGYREFLKLWKEASLVLTDSGGLQEETTALGVPCLTMRQNTERPVTVSEGSNVLVGTDPKRIIDAAREALRGSDDKVRKARPALWDGEASERILDVLKEHLRPKGSIQE